ncbi:hypothetical protein GCM10008023_26960 [Sphingomonas glacialis]|uniref:Uncharacterized protein n=1 Tax=Sphingomonas glacialis TaxID=658225 RepID=A0ABQ3LLC2_9SPHN|nr:hypothetical protein GCM10008023_26960 [Sphingomonas glacialis]
MIINCKFEVSLCLAHRAGPHWHVANALAEIGEWGGATAQRQREILCCMPERLAQLAAGLPVPL